MKISHKIIKKLFKKFFKFKIFVYSKVLSDTDIVRGKAIINQPTLFLGIGKINIANNVSLGYNPSPFFIQAICTLKQGKKLLS